MSVSQPQRHSEEPTRAIYSLSERPVDPVEDEEPRAIDSQAIEPLRSLQEMEKEAILDALQRVSGNRRKAADILGISARTLYRKLKEYEIE